MYNASSIAEISVIAIFTKGNDPRPYRFKIEENNEVITVNVEQILGVEKNKIWIEYICRSRVYGRVKDYNIAYRISDMKWFQCLN